MPNAATNQLSGWHVFLAGATAGIFVDTSLFPVDTIKSRLQSKQGFIQAGGFSHLYRGLKPVLIGSVPNSAIFFIVYEKLKVKLQSESRRDDGYFSGYTNEVNTIVSHTLAASAGEFFACSIRVPYELVKIRAQTNNDTGSLNIAKDIFRKEGLRGFFRGYKSTLIRDIPFSGIQFPIWEQIKLIHLRKFKRPASVVESAGYGSIAGGIGAFLTTPLDVAKTRIMLAEKNEPEIASGKIYRTLTVVYTEKGVRGLFAGAIPRVFWIAAGAAIFLGAYDGTIKLLGM